MSQLKDIFTNNELMNILCFTTTKK